MRSRLTAPFLTVLALCASAPLAGGTIQPRITASHFSICAGSINHSGTSSSADAGSEPADYSNVIQEYRWTHFPLRVAFKHDDNWSASREAAITAGFQDWVAATHSSVTFNDAASDKDADIIVTCNPTRDYAITRTDYYPRSAAIYHAHVDMGLCNSNSSQAVLPLSDLRALSAHEFGHALGITGHSTDRHDLMYPELDQNTSITRRDLNTLAKIYQIRL